MPPSKRPTRIAADGKKAGPGRPHRAKVDVPASLGGVKPDEGKVTHLPAPDATRAEPEALEIAPDASPKERLYAVDYASRRQLRAFALEDHSHVAVTQLHNGMMKAWLDYETAKADRIAEAQRRAGAGSIETIIDAEFRKLPAPMRARLMAGWAKL